MGQCPFNQVTDDRNQAFAKVGERVFRAGRYFGVELSADQSVRLQAFQGFGEHFGGNLFRIFRYLAFLFYLCFYKAMRNVEETLFCFVVGCACRKRFEGTGAEV